MVETKSRKINLGVLSPSYTLIISLLFMKYEDAEKCLNNFDPSIPRFPVKEYLRHIAIWWVCAASVFLWSSSKSIKERKMIKPKILFGAKNLATSQLKLF